RADGGGGEWRIGRPRPGHRASSGPGRGPGAARRDIGPPAGRRVAVCAPLLLGLVPPDRRPQVRRSRAKGIEERPEKLEKSVGPDQPPPGQERRWEAARSSTISARALTVAADPQWRLVVRQVGPPIGAST